VSVPNERKYPLTRMRGGPSIFCRVFGNESVITVSIPSIFTSVINCIDNGAERQADEKNGGSNMSVKPSTDEAEISFIG